jgi:2,3-bisphosphoglycerate-independent phosphoglycerate mutase
MICAVDLVRGLGNLIGWTAIDVPGATGNIDTNYAGKGAAAVRALADHDLVCVHVEAPDEAGHQGNWAEKKKSLEEIDRHIVGPMADRLSTFPDWRMVAMPDHPTPCAIKTHTRDVVPLVFAGSDVDTDRCEVYSELEARERGQSLDGAPRIMQLLTNEQI